ncbi:MAG TPA: hypothetical protein VIH54_10440 [Chthoniobacterales bacterium]|jgi:hypothetical protein
MTGELPGYGKPDKLYDVVDLLRGYDPNDKLAFVKSWDFGTYRRYKTSDRFRMTESERETTADLSSAKHNSDQPIIIGRKAPKFLKSLSGNLGISGPKGDPIWTRAGVCWPMPLLPSRFL